MSGSPMGALGVHLDEIEDPRSDHGKRHMLMDILAIGICAVICGGDTWVDMELFGKTKLCWLKTFLELPSGIPTQYTFRRVFGLLDPDQFRDSFMGWVRAVHEITRGQVIAIDGKTLRRSHDRRLGREAIQMVSAWAQANHLVLGQVKVADGSNEITAIPRLLELLELNGCIVTIDAIGCQRENAQLIEKQGADYVLAVKENQGRLYQDIRELFSEINHPDIAFIEHDCAQTIGKDHGRIETRRCWVLTDPDCLSYLRNANDWAGIQSLVMVQSERRTARSRSTATRYYISSLPGDAAKLLEVVRGHWSIENSLHWVLDIAFREDESRVRKNHAPQNMTTLRHIALNLIKQEKTSKGGTKAKRLRAAWDTDYLLTVLRTG